MAQFLNFKGDYKGITSAEAEENLGMYGFNSESRLDEDGKGYKPASAFFNLRTFLFLISAAVYIASGHILEGIMLLLLTGAYVFLEIFKGVKCDSALYEHKRSTAMKFRVIRDGELILIRREYLVPDDIIILQGGENVPADAHILEQTDVACDESLFSGDKTPAPKMAGADGSDSPLKSSCVYKGTRLLSGCLIARVFATGVDTLKHKTFGETKVEEVYYTSFERIINKVMPVLYILAAVFLTLFAVLNFINADFTSGDVLQTVNGVVNPAIAFALVFIPASVSSLVRIYYALGAYSLAAKHSVVKDIHVIEKMNALTCICIDKAGTITKNNLEISGESSKNPEMMTNIAILACDPVPGSSIDKAIMLGAAFRQIDVKELQQNQLIKTYPFSEKDKVAGNLWNVNGAQLLCIKGSPESVFTLCDISPENLYKAQKKQADLSRQGNQVIAVAVAQIGDGEEIPETVYGPSYSYLGLIAFNNKTKDTIPFAVLSSYKAGVNVIMTTGDSADTAAAIAKKIGMHEGRVITGDMMKAAKSNGEKLDLEGVNIFARITPEQKLEIIKMLQENGEIVGITADSGTDSEVLEQADVGITMVQNASGAAYEACDLLMNDDNFNTVVDTIKESRQIHKNVKRCISTVLSAHAAMVIFWLCNYFMGGESVITPLFAALLTVIAIPVCALLFTDNSSDLKGDHVSSGFIGRGVIDRKFFVKSVLQGVSLAMFTFLFYAISQNSSIGELRASYFAMFIFGMIAMCWTNFSDKKSIVKILREKHGVAALSTGVIIAAMLVLIYVPFVNTAFGFNGINPFVLLIALVMGVVSQCFFEIYKFVKENH